MRRVAARTVHYTTALLMVGAALWIRPVAFSAVSPQERAREWVTAHAGSLPSTLAEYSMFPEVYKREIYRAMSAQNRYELWRQHLLRVAKEERALTDEQRAFLRACRDALSVADVAPGAPYNERLADLLGQSRVVLGNHVSVLKSLFEASPRGVGFRSWIPGRVAVWALQVFLVEAFWSAMSEAVAAADAGVRYCNCNVASAGHWDCGDPETYVSCPSAQNQLCERPEYEDCDLFSNHVCDGFCCVGVPQ